MEDIALSISLSVIGVMLGLVGITWAKSSKLNPKIVNSRMKHYEDTIDELEFENKKLRGKINQSKQLLQVEGDYNLNDVSSVEALVSSILPQIKGILPKELQGLANDPKIVQFASKMYQEHPEQAKALLGKFIKRSHGPVQSPEVAAL